MKILRFVLAIACIATWWIAAGAAMADSGKTEAAIRKAFEAGKLSGLHGYMVVHKGEVLVEDYFPGSDQRWGEPLGERTHGPDTLHDLRSVTKSVTALLYGIALADDLVPQPAGSLVAQFPQYPDLTGDGERAAITVGDAMSMRMGTKWDETLPYSDPRNSEIAMERSADRYRFVLDRPLVAEPGTKWNYNGGATAVVAKLIEMGTGMTLDAYAREKLFAPLGIARYEWIRGSDGEASAASGLRLTLRDMARIGEMVAGGGTYQGRQIVPRQWIETMTAPKADIEGGLRYGYFWWLAPQGDPPAWMSGFGNGGQRLTVQPQLGLVIAIFAGNYNDPQDWKIPVALIDDYLAPGLRDRIVGK